MFGLLELGSKVHTLHVIFVSLKFLLNLEYSPLLPFFLLHATEFLNRAYFTVVSKRKSSQCQE